MGTASSTYLGIEIGGTKLQIVAGDGSGRIIDRWRAPVDRNAGGPGICRQLREGIAHVRASLSPAAIGVGFGGPVDWTTGRICRSHQIDGWENFELGSWLRGQTGLPVAVENDSNLATLAEATCGAGAGANPVFYFNLGSGVGGGVVTDGRIYHGAPPGEAEFGHLRLDRSGATVESRCSGWSIDRRIRAIANQHPDGLLARMIGQTHGGEAKHLVGALEQGDADARTILSGLADDLAFALSHAVHLLHPAIIVMGGGLSLIGEPLRAAIAADLPASVMDAFAPGPPLRLAKLGEDAVPVGALLLARGAALAAA